MRGCVTGITSPGGYFAPSDTNVIEVFPAWLSQEITLASKPKPQTPVFIGCLQVDHEGYFDARHSYAYMVDGFDEDGPEYQYTLNRKTREIKLNKVFTLPVMFVATAPDTREAVFVRFTGREYPCCAAGTEQSLYLLGHSNVFQSVPQVTRRP